MYNIAACSGSMTLVQARYEYQLSRAAVDSALKDEQLRRMVVCCQMLSVHTSLLKLQSDASTLDTLKLRNHIECLERKSNDLVMDSTKRERYVVDIENNWNSCKEELHSIIDENEKLRQRLRGFQLRKENQRIKTEELDNETTYKDSEATFLNIETNEQSLKEQSRSVNSEDIDFVNIMNMPNNHNSLPDRAIYLKSKDKSNKNNLRKGVKSDGRETDSQISENSTDLDNILSKRSEFPSWRSSLLAKPNKIDNCIKETENSKQSNDNFSFHSEVTGNTHAGASKNFDTTRATKRKGRKRKISDSPLFQLSPVKGFGNTSICVKSSQPQISNLSMTPFLKNKDWELSKNETDKASSRKENLVEKKLKQNDKDMKKKKNMVEASPTNVVPFVKRSFFDDQQKKSNDDKDAHLFSPVNSVEIQRLEKVSSPIRKEAKIIKRAFKF